MTDSDVESVMWRGQVPVQDSATQRITVNKQKISVLSALNEVLKERRSIEHRRNQLLQTAALRQHQVQETKTKCEAAWTEKIANAQATGGKYEAQCCSLREKRELLHKQLMASIEGSSPNKSTHDVPSIRANYKMQACQLQRDIVELKRRVGNCKFRLESETKTAQVLHVKVKHLRTEASSKKHNSGTIRPQTLALLSHATQCRPTRENFRLNILKNSARHSTPVTLPLGKAL